MQTEFPIHSKEEALTAARGIHKVLGYRFKQLDLLQEALRHASWVNEQACGKLKDNERLEFLGDTVLDLVISHLLMERHPDADEGQLSRYRAMLVDESGLCEVARGLSLGRFIWLGRGEEQSNGREKASILANGLEALLGALYLEAGFDKAFEIIRTLFLPFLDRVAAREREHDYKSLFQEYTQRVYKTLPQYRLIKVEGPAHERRFEVGLALNGKIVASGTGRSKKEAEQEAAREAFLNAHES